MLLLHGWPDDATTWAEVAPALNAAGLRTVTPFLRGFGDTRFRATDILRSGNSGILAHDAVELMDAMAVERFMVAGHDWGSNTAEASRWAARPTFRQGFNKCPIHEPAGQKGRDRFDIISTFASGEKRSGKPFELVALERQSIERLRIQPPAPDLLPSASEQLFV